MISLETMWMYFLPITLGVCFCVLTFYFVYLKIRPKFPIRVNCWFCNQNSVVPYDNRNCWDCVHCEQYNGFSVDGGYNKVIPAQHDELLNHSESVKASKKEKESPVKDALCRRCSINQQLKVQQLAAFSATNPNSFEEEVEEYRQHLERAYQLCSACERVLKQRLNQQQGWLLGLYRRELYARKFQEASDNGARGCAGDVPDCRWAGAWAWTSRVLALAPLPLAPLLIGAHGRSLAPTMLEPFLSADALWLLSLVMEQECLACIGGCVATATSAAIRILYVYTCLASVERKRIALSSVDVLAPVLWAAAAGHQYLLDSGALGEEVAVTDRALARLVLLVVVMALNVVAAFHPQDTFSVKSAQPAFSIKRHSNSQVNGKRHMTEIFSSPEPSERSMPSSSLCVPPPPLSVSCPLPASSRAPSSSSSPPPPSLLSSSFPSDAEELEWSLGRLRLGGSGAGLSRPVRGRSSPWGRTTSSTTTTTTSAAFGPSPPRHASPGATTLFRPARLALRHVTQASWVAGGYWGALGPPSPAPLSSFSGSWAVPRAGEGASPLTEASLGALSRCSSQSSGFHSHSSASPGCASASMCGGASSEDGAASSSHPLPTSPTEGPNCSPGPLTTWWWSPPPPATPAATPWGWYPVAALPPCGWPGGGSDVSGGGGRRTPTPPTPSTAASQWLMSPWLMVLCIASTFTNAAVLCTAVITFKDQLFA